MTEELKQVLDKLDEQLSSAVLNGSSCGMAHVIVLNFDEAKLLYDYVLLHSGQENSGLA